MTNYEMQILFIYNCTVHKSAFDKKALLNAQKHFLSFGL